jgi:LmbE family N-acetylglucosaminyl deacetylase
MNKKLCLLAFLTFYATTLIHAQSSNHIKVDLEKLAQSSRVLYLAAHPDDENTRLISYLENDLKIRTAYLSLTRGDGGQNLIGTEKGASLGMLRTQELLEARKIDGAEQFFTSAVDFGYSKTDEETFEKWNKDSILHDVVWVIRKFQPHVIITRFPPNSKAGHGHHTASAILAEEAFDLAGDKNVFPEQLAFVDVWKPTHLYQNTSTWWDKSLPEKALTNDSILAINVGGYNPLLGMSYGEIASMARSKHRCQGFGSALQRGEQIEYLTLLKGKSQPSFQQVFANNWLTLKKGKEIDQLITSINQAFDFENSQKSMPQLIALLKLIESNNSPWLAEKKALIKRTILACSGVFEGWYSNKPYYLSIDSMLVEQRLIKRIKSPLTFISATYDGISLKTNLEVNTMASQEFKSKLTQHPYSIPYYLEHPFTNRFTSSSYETLGLPENNVSFVGISNWEFKGFQFEVKNPIVYNYVDRSIGEINTLIQVLPAISITLDKQTLITKNQQSKSITFTLENNTNEIITNTLKVLSKNNMGVNPGTLIITLQPLEKSTHIINITPTKNTSEDIIQFAWGNQLINQVVTVDYDHINKQTWVSPAALNVKNIPLIIGKEKIAYINGSGDEVADYLRILGYQVSLFDESDLDTFDPSKYDVVLLGIRALNVNKGISGIKEKLNTFVNNGGRLIVQYNTNRGLLSPYLGEASFTISRSRVTDEAAEMTFLAPNHPILDYPNKITQNDFNDWVQERGLYFANEWDSSYTPIIAWNDLNEDPQYGGLIVAKQGKGSVVYTGISFFRQLPAGVPGAYRLFANIISFKYD